MTEGDVLLQQETVEIWRFYRLVQQVDKKKRKKAAPLKMCSVVIFYVLFICQPINTHHSQVRTPPSETTLFLFPLPYTWRVQKSICFSSGL